MGKNATEHAIDTLNSEVMAENVPSPTVDPEKKEYLVKEFNNKIGIYENNQLIRIIDVDVSSLRTDDVKKLKGGITLETREDLAKFLEDYSS